MKKLFTTTLLALSVLGGAAVAQGSVSTGIALTSGDIAGADVDRTGLYTDLEGMYSNGLDYDARIFTQVDGGEGVASGDVDVRYHFTPNLGVATAYRFSDTTFGYQDTVYLGVAGKYDLLDLSVRGAVFADLEEDNQYITRIGLKYDVSDMFEFGGDLDFNTVSESNGDNTVNLDVYGRANFGTSLYAEAGISGTDDDNVDAETYRLGVGFRF